MARRLHTTDADFERAFTELVEGARHVPEDVAETVRAIIADIRERGFGAVLDSTRRFDGFDPGENLSPLDAQALDAARRKCSGSLVEDLEFAAARIRDYHRRQMPADHDYVDAAGVRLGWRWTPVSAAGLYAPGGRAAYPSSVLMNAIPATVAGVKRLCMCAPTPGGVVNPAVLAAASIAGVSELWPIGGAQAIAAMAYGAAPIAPVDVIVGPGNAFVAEAKRQVFGVVGIDAVAGPSEILVVADAANEPEWIAADLLSQAEHDPSSQSVLITDDSAFADVVAAEVDRQLAASPRREIAAAAWNDNSAVIVVGALGEAPALIDALAPEHLELAVADPDALAAKVSNAGAIFLGRHTPEALGDYVAGPNHVLPTARTARYASGLSPLNFMKRTSIISAGEQAVAKIGPAAARLADVEGLPSHARSVRLRIRD
ncbi:MAG: histidinol dehydrogenase [Parvularculaceae bacterium]|nr:histidinol dehydrogenase [Parvularculaceae bacterium]